MDKAEKRADKKKYLYIGVGGAGHRTLSVLMKQLREKAELQENAEDTRSPDQADDA